MNDFQRVWELSKKHPNGFTYHLKERRMIITGFIAAFLETQDSLGNDGLEKCLEHAKSHENLIGGWKNENGEMQFDSCKRFTDREEAIRFARENKQRYLIDLTNLELIRVGG